MKPSRSLVFALGAALALAAAVPVGASFHLMQIEQVSGGFCGIRDAQAIQLRMRTAGQNLTAGAALIAYDAAGNNPVTLLTLPGNVANGAGGTRVLLATPNFTYAGGPTPDFVLANPIPVSYLEAGKVTWAFGATVYWSLAWGGASYTGTNTGVIDNDADGNFNPPFAGALPALDDVALRFTGAAGAASTNNAADYALSPSPATFVNNAGSSSALNVCVFYDGFESGDTSAWSSVVPP
jgi:hypothetical protein